MSIVERTYLLPSTFFDNDASHQVDICFPVPPSPISVIAKRRRIEGRPIFFPLLYFYAFHGRLSSHPIWSRLSGCGVLNIPPSEIFFSHQEHRALVC